MFPVRGKGEYDVKEIGRNPLDDLNARRALSCNRRPQCYRNYVIYNDDEKGNTISMVPCLQG
jgi:hypothetical protein